MLNGKVGLESSGKKGFLLFYLFRKILFNNFYKVRL